MLERIDVEELGRPPRLPKSLPLVSAVWVIAKRTPLAQRSSVRPGVRQASELCMRFKNGEGGYAPELADAMVAQLTRVDWRMGPDTSVVPIPLSPEKLEQGVLDRAGVLADAIAASLGLSVCRWLTLAGSVAKRELQSDRGKGFWRGEFERRYRELLQADPEARGSVLLVDDVCSHGSTLKIAAAALSGCELVGAVTAGQITLKSVVLNPEALMAHNEGRLSESEMVDILEEIARHAGNAAARIAAIKVLREMDAGEKPSSAGFAALDELETRRLRTKVG